MRLFIWENDQCGNKNSLEIFRIFCTAADKTIICPCPIHFRLLPNKPLRIYQMDQCIEFIRCIEFFSLTVGQKCSTEFVFDEKLLGQFAASINFGIDNKKREHRKKNYDKICSHFYWAISDRHMWTDNSIKKDNSRGTKMKR